MIDWVVQVCIRTKVRQLIGLQLQRELPCVTKIQLLDLLYIT